MSWTDVGEFIKAIAPVFTAGAACTGAYIGYRGLEKWRAETAGKRQADLAEQVLVNFYSARDALQWARSSGFTANEGQSRTPHEAEPEQVRVMRNAYFIPIERLNREKELFARLRVQRYLFMAYFGGAKTKPFDTIARVHSSIALFATQLIRIAALDGSVASVSASRDDLLNKLGWGTSERPDSTDKDVDAAVLEMETLCRPILEGRKP